MLDSNTIQKIEELLNQGKVILVTHCQCDIIKQNYNWSLDFIVKCLKEGKKYKGCELYPDIKERHDRNYCIHKPYLFSKKLILIWFEISDQIVVIHIEPLNSGSKEGKIYYNLQ